MLNEYDSPEEQRYLIYYIPALMKNCSHSDVLLEDLMIQF